MKEKDSRRRRYIVVGGGLSKEKTLAPFPPTNSFLEYIITRRIQF